jgi:3',5'-cyclic AMP phosphodiesterase CpdA
LHFGRHDPAIAEALLASIDTENPDLVVVSGDFTQRARSAEFMAAKEFIERIAAPKIVVPGNHDVPLYNLLSRLFRPFDKYNRFIRPAGLPSAFFADESIAVLGLNSARRLTRKNGRVSYEQMADIRRAFGSLPSSVFKVLVTHHPLAAPRNELTLELAERSRKALEVVAECGIHLLLSGHHHRSINGGITTETARASSVLIVHAGTAISTRTRGQEGNSFNIIRVQDSRVDVRIMGWNAGPGYVESGSTSYTFSEGHWQAA